MVAINYFYKHFNRSPINFTFIQFEQYVKVILSLLCTEDTSVVSSQIVYGKISSLRIIMKLFDHLLTEKNHVPNDIIREYYNLELFQSVYRT